MESNEAVAALSALAQDTRLALFRRLVEAGPAGLAAGEMCPVWPGHPVTAHWGFTDPAAFVGPDAQKALVFADVFRQIERRIRIFCALPLETLSRQAIQREVTTLGKTEAETT